MSSQDRVLNQIIDHLLAIPGLRFIFGLVNASLRPFLAVLLLAGTLYLLSRAAHYVSLRSTAPASRNGRCRGNRSGSRLVVHEDTAVLE
jgi:hypothetical protein